MSEKNESRLRRAKATRSHIKKLGVPFYCFHDVDAMP